MNIILLYCYLNDKRQYFISNKFSIGLNPYIKKIFSFIHIHFRKEPETIADHYLVVVIVFFRIYTDKA